MTEQPRAIAVTPTTAATVDPTFPRFPELPAELRFIIWGFALPRRVFEIRHETIYMNVDSELEVDKDSYHRSGPSERVAVLLAPPALLWVCREARKIAQRTGSWKYVGSRCRTHDVIKRLKTWFDPLTDTLCFDDPWAVEGQIRERDGIIIESANNPAITRVYFGNSPASPVCLGLEVLTVASGKFFVEQWKRKRGFWSGVPRYLFYRESILMHLGRSRRVQEIFGKGADRCYTLLVDAHDRVKLRQLKDLYVDESDPEFFRGETASYLELMLDPSYGYIDRCFRELRNVWLEVQSDDAPDSAMIFEENDEILFSLLTEPNRVPGATQQFDHTHAWSKEIIDNMPKMDPVVRFRLCLTNHEVLGSGTSCDGNIIDIT